MRAWLTGAVAAVTLLTLSACDKSDTAAPAETPSGSPSGKTLAAMIADNGQLSTVSTALKDAGLAQVFDGAAPYTILAPQDSAFEKLGASGAELKKPEQRAAMVAVLRDHILPGYLTPRDVSEAIDRAAGNGAKMRTMGGHVVTFTKNGQTITATQEDGSAATLVGNPALAGNGVALPIDGVLKKL